MAECYAALERKAALYDRLAAGQGDDDEDLYNVDFLHKSFQPSGTLEDERLQMEAASTGPGDAMHDRHGTSEPVQLQASVFGPSGRLCGLYKQFAAEVVLWHCRAPQACIVQIWNASSSGKKWEEREQATYQAERQAEDDRDAKIQVGGSLFLPVLVEHGNLPPQCKQTEGWWCQTRPLELVGVCRL